MKMNYKSARWKRKRQVILKRDSYLCKECLRYGKTTPATSVHHIKPVESNPELKYDNKNLYSCCNECHNSFHNRLTGELTDKGMRLIAIVYK